MEKTEPRAQGTKKILFIIPPFFDVRAYIAGGHKSQQPVFTIPYGVLSLAAYVKTNTPDDMQIEIIDLNLEAYRLCHNSADLEAGLKDRISDKMLCFQPDIVGISALFNTCFNYLGLISSSVNDIERTEQVPSKQIHGINNY